MVDAKREMFGLAVEIHSTSPDDSHGVESQKIDTHLQDRVPRALVHGRLK